MNRLSQRFATLRERGEKALVTFVTAGDPWPERTAEVLLALEAAGADVLEVGIPFSDPIADGPVVQNAGFRALAAGMTPPRVLEIVREARARGVAAPIVLMGAWNPFLQYGSDAFARDAVAAGADGTIVTDLTPEEAGEWKRACDGVDLATVFLLAPTSTPARMALVAQMASGFIYCVSRTGVTGARDDIPADLPPLVAAIRERAGTIPVCVGFGVATPEHARSITRFADGVVVGSRLVTLLHENRDRPDGLTLATDFVRSLKEATR